MTRLRDCRVMPASRRPTRTCGLSCADAVEQVTGFLRAIGKKPVVVADLAGAARPAVGGFQLTGAPG